jgi:G3E family GTPase
LLGNGCVCCLMRSDLQETLRALFAERTRGEAASFRRVVIETSGLADPGPVLQTFASDRALGEEFHLQSLVAVVDVVGGPGNLAAMEEARHQVVLADRIVMTKTDLAPPAAADALREMLGHLTAAPIAVARDGVIDPAFLLDDAIEGLVTPDHHDHDHAHSDGIASFTVEFDRPLPWPVVEQAMAVLTGLRGADLLRVKGLVAVEGCRGPVVVHAVQHVAHRPVELEEWPGGDRRSRLVFIARNIGREAVERLFAAIAAI